ncbi:hypothetical protein PMIN06_009113 [Paraphaeosphaeria minitans]
MGPPVSWAIVLYKVLVGVLLGLILFRAGFLSHRAVFYTLGDKVSASSKLEPTAELIRYGQGHSLNKFGPNINVHAACPEMDKWPPPSLLDSKRKQRASDPSSNKRHGVEIPWECSMCGEQLSRHDKDERDMRRCDFCVGKRDTGCYNCQRKFENRDVYCFVLQQLWRRGRY